MEWLNLHLSVLDSPEVIGADPVERGTWLMLLRYCIGQENSGIIKNCRTWPDRKWQQIARVTQAEAQASSDLWAWHGNDLHVTHYPIAKEAIVKGARAGGSKKTQAKTQASRVNGKAGGRKKNPSHSQAKTQAPAQGETQQKGKEGNGKEKEGEERADARRAAEALVSACPFPDLTIPALTAAADCLRRHAEDHSFEDILAATRTATALYRQWPENERLAFRSSAERFFREDLWRRHPDAWRSRRAARTSIHSTGLDLDLGNRSAPPGGDLVFPSNPTTATA